MRYRRQKTTYAITVENPDAVCRGVRQLSLDGVDLPSRAVPLADDGGEHVVRVVLLERCPAPLGWRCGSAISRRQSEPALVLLAEAPRRRQAGRAAESTRVR
jgi:hypothetical protein